MMHLITVVRRNQDGGKVEMTYRLAFPFDRGQSDWAIRDFRENVARVATMSTFSILHGACAATAENLKQGRWTEAPSLESSTEVLINRPGKDGAPASLSTFGEAVRLKAQNKASHWLHKRWSENQWCAI